MNPSGLVSRKSVPRTCGMNLQALPRSGPFPKRFPKRTAGHGQLEKNF